MSRDFTGGSNHLKTTGGPASLNIVTAEDPYSISAWIRPDTVASELTVISKYNGFGPILRVLGTAKIGFFTVDAGSAGQEAISAGSLSSGVWQHVGGSWDSSTLRIWVGGVQDGSTAMSTQHTNQATDWCIGARPGGTIPFDGLIAEVGLWNVALTADEYRALGSGISPRLIRPESLVGYWPLYGSGFPEANLAGVIGTTYMTQQGTVGVGETNPPVMPFSIEDLDETEQFPFLADAATVDLRFTISGLETGYDEATVPLALTVTSDEIREISDADTVLLDLQPSGVEFREQVDAATVYLTLSVLGGECFSTYTGQFLGEGEADLRWMTDSDLLRWIGDAESRWSEGSIVVEGINC